MSPEEEFDCGNEELSELVFQELSSGEGFDCTSVEMLLGMARNGEIDAAGDVLGYLAQKGQPNWAAEIAKILMGTASASSQCKEQPDYAVMASVMTYLVDQGDAGVESAHRISKFLLVMRPNNAGADCYDLSEVIGHMAKQRKAAAGSKILFAIYADESPEGQAYATLVPFVLGVLVDNKHTDWSAELSKYLFYADGTDKSIDYSVMGWALGQHTIFFNRPDWAAAIIDALRAQSLAWFNEKALLDAIGEQVGDPSVPQVIASMLQRPGMAPPQRR